MPSPTDAPQTATPVTGISSGLPSVMLSAKPVIEPLQSPPLTTAPLPKEPQQTIAETIPKVVSQPTSAVSTDLAAARSKIVELERQVVALEGELVGRDITIRSMQPAPEQATSNSRPALASMPIPTIDVPGIETRRVGDTVRIAIPESMIFQAGTTDVVQGSGEELLRRMISELRVNYPDHVIEVEGHTDTLAMDPRFPSQLLDQTTYQAKVVAQHLVEALRIPPEKLRVVGCGASDPIADNATEEGRLRNRRIELVVRRGG